MYTIWVTKPGGREERYSYRDLGYAWAWYDYYTGMGWPCRKSFGS